MSHLGHPQNSSRPSKPTTWKIRQSGNKYISVGADQIQQLEQQLVNQTEMGGGKGYPDIEKKMLYRGPDFETFHCFSELPSELQNIVWSYCCNIRRRVEVVDNKAKPSAQKLSDNKAKPSIPKLAFVCKTPNVPPVLHICRAAREIGLTKYLVLSTSVELPASEGPSTSGEPPKSEELLKSQEPPKIYFNPEADIICFGRRCFSGLDTINWLERNTHIQYIECRMQLWRLYSERWASQLFNTLCKFDHLKEITFFYEAVSLEPIYEPIIRKGFENITEVKEGWRAPKVSYVDIRQ